MFLHLGKDSVINTDDILGIFDLDNTSVSKWTRQYLSSQEKEKNVIYVSLDLPKSFIVTAGRKGTLIYVSPLSPATLIKRIEQLEKN